MMLMTTDEQMQELQSTEICQCNTTSKSSNDAEVIQHHKPLHQQQVLFIVILGLSGTF